MFQQEYAAKISDNFRITKFSDDNIRAMCKILSRIKALADAEGVSIGTIERAIGASRGVISKAIAKGTDIQSKWLELICEKFPQYSPVWLLTGEGEMLRASSNTTRGHSKDTVEEVPAEIFTPSSQKLSHQSDIAMVTAFLDTIKQQAEEIGRLKARIDELEGKRVEPTNTVPRPVHSAKTETVKA